MKSNISRKQLINSVFRLFATMNRGICRSRVAVFQGSELTSTQSELLFKLFLEGPVHMSQLAQKLFIGRSAATQLVTGLERQKFIERQQEANDRRQWLIKLTTSAEKLLNEMHEKQYQQMKQIFEGFTESELLSLEMLLQRLDNNIIKLKNER